MSEKEEEKSSQVQVVSVHPLLRHKITILRSSSTVAGSFRACLREVTYHLGYEATASLTTRPIAISVPCGHDHIDAEGFKIVEKVALIPILRSGLVSSLFVWASNFELSKSIVLFSRQAGVIPPNQNLYSFIKIRFVYNGTQTQQNRVW